MKTLLTLALLFFPLHAGAQVLSVEGLCETLPDYRQAEGVEHVPGAEDVVPADLNAIKNPINEPVSIPVEIDLGARFNLNLPSDIELKPEVATIKVYQDGRIEYNGQDISRQLYAECGQEPPEKSETADGQPPKDAVISQPEVKQPEKTIESEVLEGQYPAKDE